LKYAIIDLILALGGEKGYVECQILFSWKESDMLNAKYYFHRRKVILRENIPLSLK
jgi:hypothetical protein